MILTWKTSLITGITTIVFSSISTAKTTHQNNLWVDMQWVDVPNLDKPSATEGIIPKPSGSNKDNKKDSKTSGTIATKGPGDTYNLKTGKVSAKPGDDKDGQKTKGEDKVADKKVEKSGEQPEGKQANAAKTVAVTEGLFRDSNGRPAFTNAQRLNVGPPVSFVTGDGRQVSATALLNGQIPPGTPLTMITAEGRSIAGTTVAQDAVATIAGQSNNYRNPAVSFPAIRGGGPAGISSVIGFQPTVSTSLRTMGIRNAREMDYYAGTQDMLTAMAGGNLRAGPAIYLLDVNGYRANVVGGGGGGGATANAQQ